MTKPQLLPLLKWAGGKRQLLPELHKTINQITYNRYFEPFIGGGALLFSLQPTNTPVMNDINEELINVYRVVKESPDKLIEDIGKHKHTEEYFYNIRNMDREPDWQLNVSPIERASRIIYLNKTCFNGLFRTNKKGQFNVPYGRYKNPRYIDIDNVFAISKYLNDADVQILHGDFEAAVEGAVKGDLIYFDPPYDPVSETANFTAYTKEGFGRDEQIRLKECCDTLTEKGIAVVISSSATDFIEQLYSDYAIKTITAARAINVKGCARGPINELIITNSRLV